MERGESGRRTIAEEDGEQVYLGRAYEREGLVERHSEDQGVECQHPRPRRGEVWKVID